MGKFIGGIVFTLLVMAIGGYCVLKFGMVNIGADQTPSRARTACANAASAARTTPRGHRISVLRSAGRNSGRCVRSHRWSGVPETEAVCGRYSGAAWMRSTIG